MDVSRYGFLCQKALHQGLQYARSFGHRFLEIEHIAIVLLRSETLLLPKNGNARLQHELQKHLSKFRRIYGEIKIEFGIRLDKALDEAETKAGKELVDEKLLWECFANHSDVIKKFLKDEENFSVREEPPRSPRVSKATEASESKAEPLKKAKGEKKEATPSHFQIPDNLAEVLEKYTMDLTALAERGELDPVVGRDFETRRVIEILGRKKKNNPILIGEPGVGKTAVAEALALKIAEGLVPQPMKGKRILSLDLSGLIAGARFRGEFEERMKTLLKAIQACGGSVILFIDEIHMLVGAGSAEGSADAANMLKPALARGELRCLGATTLDEFRNYIEKDPALERRFQPVHVEEPSRSATLAILRGIKGKYEVHHGVQINDDALVACADLSIRYLTSRNLPDKAIDLLDEACSRLRIQIDSLPTVMDNLNSQINQLEIEKNAINKADLTAAKELSAISLKLQEARKEYQKHEKIWTHHKSLLENLRKIEGKKQELDSLFENTKQKGDFEFAAKLQFVELPKALSESESIKKELKKMQDEHSWLRQIVGAPEAAEVVALLTGVPVQSLLKDESEALVSMESHMKQRVFGQDEALSKVSRAVRRARVGISDPNRPIGVFLFCGPTGVGKTETVKALAEELFNDANKMVRIDMSEYMEQHNIARLIGSPPGYVGYGEGGELTEAVRRNPYTVVLFDEIEKAHPRVLDLLLQAFDDGRLTDGKGRLVNFRNTLMVMTSNIPIESKEGASRDEVEEDARTQLSRVLRPELVGRIDEVVLFKTLGQVHFDSLLQRLLIELNKRLTKDDFRVLLGPVLQKQLREKSHIHQFGGRALRRSFQNLVIDPVSDRLLSEPALCRGPWLLEIDEKGLFIWQASHADGLNLPAAS